MLYLFSFWPPCSLSRSQTEISIANWDFLMPNLTNLAFLMPNSTKFGFYFYLRLAGLQVVSVVVLLLLVGGGGGGIYQQNSELRQDRDFLYKIPNEANIKCQLWYFIQWFKILPLGGVRPKFAKLGQILEKSLCK
jgi:hypothetical protein